MSAWIAMAAARGILLTCNKSMPEEYGGGVRLNRPNQVMQQLEGRDIETSDIQPIDLKMAVMKEVGKVVGRNGRVLCRESKNYCHWVHSVRQLSRSF